MNLSKVTEEFGPIEKEVPSIRRSAALPIASVSRVWFCMILYPASTSFLSSSNVKSVVFLLTAEATPISFDIEVCTLNKRAKIK